MLQIRQVLQLFRAVLRSAFGQPIFGQIVLVRIAVHTWYGRSTDGPGSWRVRRQFSGGGVLSDVGVHKFDQLAWWFGTPKRLIAHVDTRNGIVDGRVARIDPTVRQGTVQVDIELDGPLPPGARPDLSVEGRVNIEVLEDVIHVDRPASAVGHNRVELFRVAPDGETATRVEVQLGRASVSSIVIVAGLAEGDRIVVSDTHHWDEYDRLHFK